MGFTRIIRFPKSYSKSRFLNSFCQERFSQNMYLPKQPDWSLGTNLNFCIPEYETVPRVFRNMKQFHDHFPDLQQHLQSWA